jgi:hypothetical protein
MQAALISEVVVEHRLVGVSVCSDFVRASASHTLRSEMALGGCEDAPRGGGVLDFSAS